MCIYMCRRDLISRSGDIRPTLSHHVACGGDDFDLILRTGGWRWSLTHDTNAAYGGMRLWAHYRGDLFLFSLFIPGLFFWFYILPRRDWFAWREFGCL